MFTNPHKLIWESITWAFDEVRSLPAGTLDVIVNARNLSSGPGEINVLDDVRRRDGASAHFDGRGLVQIER